jgi:uncharacterized protein (TIGR00266 family)
VQYEIQKRPSYAMVEVTLGEGEEIQTKPGAMMTRTAGIGTESSVGGDDGVMGIAKRAVSDERDLVENRYYAERDDETVTLVPEHPGDVNAFNVTDVGDIRAQSGALLAWEPLVERSTQLNDVSNMFSSGELTVLGLSGRGMAFISAYGSMYREEVTDGEPLIVDEDHIVAWTAELSLSRQRDGGLKSTMLGGEGYVTEFRGSGYVWLQTRNPLSLMQSAGGTEHEDTDVSANEFLG